MKLEGKFLCDDDAFVAATLDDALRKDRISVLSRGRLLAARGGLLSGVLLLLALLIDVGTIDTFSHGPTSASAKFEVLLVFLCCISAVTFNVLDLKIKFLKASLALRVAPAWGTTSEVA